MPRGRAASSIRPGIMIKDVLTSKVPLYNGQFVTESSIVDLHRTYQNLISMENTLRPKYKHLHGMTYPSFVKLFKFSQLLGLVEFIREEPMEFPPPGNPLLSIRIGARGKRTVQISARRFFKISANGLADEKSWTNLCRSWIDEWPIPQKIEIPLVTKIPEKVERVVKGPWEPFVRVANFTHRQAVLLTRHFSRLKAEGLTDAVKHELERVELIIADWQIAAEEKAGKLTGEDASYYENIADKLSELTEVIQLEDIDSCLEIIDELEVMSREETE